MQPHATSHNAPTPQWYFKGNGGGVANWTVRPDIFPEHGGGDAALAQFHKDTEWPIVGHNRYCSFFSNASVSGSSKQIYANVAITVT